MDNLKRNVETIEKNIEKAAKRSARKREDITLVSVTKTVNSTIIEKLIEYGMEHIGENRVQVAQEKKEELASYKDITWHMIGNLQRNKVKKALELFDFFHSVESLKLANEIDKKATSPIPILLEVNVSGEESKRGFSERDLREAIGPILELPNVKVEGFMTMAPFTSDMSICRNCFVGLRKIAETLRGEYKSSMPHLSMGMTQDYEIAIEEGATIVRIGSAFLGIMFKGIFMSVLLVEKGSSKGASVTYSGKTLTVGRDVNSSLQLDDTGISRNHFQISFEDNTFQIQDTGSTNGTLLNGHFISEKSPLKDGDSIKAGETTLLWLKDKANYEKDPLIGKKIRGYLILSRLGKGGMGTVYKAKQISLDREVALKILNHTKVSERFIKQFMEEARSAAALNHSNIIQVYDVGEASNFYYLSMEYASLGSLQNMLSGGKKLPYKEALDYMLDVAKGLEYAERKKIVHRDIKPDNLMISEENTVKIGDLGIAQRLDDKEKDNRILGTPHFIAPEQAQGKTLDHRADIYAFGATFYRILSGKTPFQGNNIKTIVLSHINKPVKPLKEIEPSIPDELCNLIEKMLQKNRVIDFKAITKL